MARTKGDNGKRTALSERIAEHVRHFKAGEHASMKQAVAIAFSELGLSRKQKGKK